MQEQDSLMQTAIDREPLTQTEAADEAGGVARNCDENEAKCWWCFDNEHKGKFNRRRRQSRSVAKQNEKSSQIYYDAKQITSQHTRRPSLLLIGCLCRCLPLGTLTRKLADRSISALCSNSRNITTSNSNEPTKSDVAAWRPFARACERATTSTIEQFHQLITPRSELEASGSLGSGRAVHVRQMIRVKS